MHVIVTLPEPRAAQLVDRLRARGMRADALIFSRLTPLPGAPSGRELLALVAQSDWVVPVSPTAVDLLFERLGQAWPAGPAMAVIGPGSLLALQRQRQWSPQCAVVMPVRPPYDGAHLIACEVFQSIRGRRVLVIRGEQGRDDWIEVLAARGASVQTVALYRNESVQPDPGADRLLTDVGDRRTWLFSSREVAIRAIAWLRERGRSGIPVRDLALVTHERVASVLQAQGWRALRLVEPGEAGLLTALESEQ